MARIVPVALVALLTGAAGCSAPALPRIDGAVQDLSRLPATKDMRQPADQLAPSGPTLVAKGSQTALDAITQNGQAVAYHDGTTEFVLSTALLDPTAPLTIAENVIQGQTQASYNTILSLSQQGKMANVATLSSWLPGDTSAAVLDTQAAIGRTAVAASPDGTYVAYVFSDDSGNTGRVELRRHDQATAVANVLPGMSLLLCQVELAFYDPTHLVVFYCLADGRGRVTVTDMTGTLTQLSSSTSEDVEQVHVVPGGRVLWTDKMDSAAGYVKTLMSATIDGQTIQPIDHNVPPQGVAQLTLSPAGDFVYYLTATAALNKVDVLGKVATLTLTANPVTRIQGVSPDNGIIAVTRPGAAPGTDELSLIDTLTQAGVDAPLATTLSAMGFSADSTLAFYLPTSATLQAFPVRGPSGAAAITVHGNVGQFLPLAHTDVLFLHDQTPAMTWEGSVADARAPQTVTNLDSGMLFSPSGSLLLTPDRTKLIYLKQISTTEHDLYEVAIP